MSRLKMSAKILAQIEQKLNELSNMQADKLRFDPLDSQYVVPVVKHHIEGMKRLLMIF